MNTNSEQLASESSLTSHTKPSSRTSKSAKSAAKSTKKVVTKKGWVKYKVVAGELVSLVFTPGYGKKTAGKYDLYVGRYYNNDLFGGSKPLGRYGQNEKKTALKCFDRVDEKTVEKIAALSFKMSIIGSQYTLLEHKFGVFHDLDWESIENAREENDKKELEEV